MTFHRTFNRRRHERFRLQPMYTDVVARTSAPEGGGFVDGLHGHAYDISESGVRIELDEPFDVGQSIDLDLALPGGEFNVSSKANVVWVHDSEDDPGPRRMALKFTDFKTPADHDRLVSFLSRGLQRVAA